MCEVSSTIDTCISDGDEFPPNAEELEALYSMLEAGTIPELQWKFPGRLEEQVVQTKTAQPVKDIEIREPVKNDFDFSDDIGQPQMPRVRTLNSTPKSAKKKQANFAGVMEVLKKKNAEGS